MYVVTRSDSRSQDSLGNKLVIASPVKDDGTLDLTSKSVIIDDVAPALDKDNTFIVASVTGITYKATFNLTEEVDVDLSRLNADELFEVKVTPNGNGDAQGLVVKNAFPAVSSNGVHQLVVEFDYNGAFNNDDVIFVKYNAKYSDAIKDTAGKSMSSFEATSLYRNAK